MTDTIIPIKTTITPEQLLTALGQLPVADLNAFVGQVLALRAQREAPQVSRLEAELLMRINQGLPPSALQRYAELIGKRQQAVLTDEEYTELLQLTDQVEACDADRIVALAELAQLRHRSLAQIMQDLEIQPVPAEKKHSILELAGLGTEVWEGIDAQEYVNQLRDEWEQRS